MKLIYLLGAILIFIGCKKTELEGELPETMIGKWVWYESSFEINGEVSSNNPYTESKEVEIQFEREGILQLIVNGECERKHRIKSYEVRESGENKSIHFDLSSKKGFDTFTVFFISGETEIFQNDEEDDFYTLDLPDSSNGVSYSHFFEKLD